MRTLHAVVGCSRFLATVFSLCAGTQRPSESKDRNAPETVLESSRDMFEVSHPAGSRGLSALGLLSPLVGTQLRSGIAALRAV